MTLLKLSYVITTYNRLPLLNQVLSRLIREAKDDEEIIVADGNSTDGTVGYLQKLLERGQIQKFVTEPDQGEAHGYNKAIILAEGELIKMISDDDAFYWPGIQECKEFMLANSKIDLLLTNGANYKLTSTKQINHLDYEHAFMVWKHSFVPFPFCGLGLMLRRSSLPLIGLLNPSFERVDAEFSIRVTASQVNLGLYTGCNFLRILNERSKSRTINKIITQDGQWLDFIYLGHKPARQPVLQKAQNRLRYFLRLILKKMRSAQRSPVDASNDSKKNQDWGTIFQYCYQWLNDYNENHLGTKFVTGDSSAFPVKELNQQRRLKALLNK